MGSYLTVEQHQPTAELIAHNAAGILDYNYLGNYTNYDAAVCTILKQKPDLVFYNIDGPDFTIDTLLGDLNQFGANDVKLIALSDSNEKAIQALNNDFLYYLLKPAKELDILKALLKFKHRKEADSQLFRQNCICLKSYKDYHYLNTSEIIYLKADNNTTDFHLNDGRVITAFKTLKTFEDLLPTHFIRSHKSYIINSLFVSKISFGKLTCYFNCISTALPFSNTYLKSIKNLNAKLFQNALPSVC
ncbi:LytR/AlgR family response regulator transcription factor [Robertkochia solimangrovi]|uniref:LytR/AlgR family response regulator transcription factor n=1 Tax=Robertkochia solimangrovi TaxID=2213046 RepID=UPI0013A59C52|nr:LytTR family DNA-binding domain-containing protein [Robertkochia solimangrovi]